MIKNKQIKSYNDYNLDQLEKKNMFSHKILFEIQFEDIVGVFEVDGTLIICFNISLTNI